MLKRIAKNGGDKFIFSYLIALIHKTAEWQPVFAEDKGDCCTWEIFGSQDTELGI